MAETIPRSIQPSAFLRLPTEVRLDIYRFLFHNPAPLLYIRPSGCGNSDPCRNVGLLKTNSYFPDRASILLSCHQCNAEAGVLFYESIRLDTCCAHIVLPFIAHNLRGKRNLVKHITLYLYNKKLPNPTMKWTAILPNIEKVELDYFECHDSRLEPKGFACYSAEKVLRRGARWLNTFGGFRRECEAPRPFKAYIRIQSCYILTHDKITRYMNGGVHLTTHLQHEHELTKHRRYCSISTRF